MQLTIGSQVYHLAFGLSFIAHIDETYGITHKGVNVGMGLVGFQAKLSTGSPVALYDGIKAATSHLSSKPSNSALESYLFGGGTERLEELTELFLTALEDSREVKMTVESITARVARMQGLTTEELLKQTATASSETSETSTDASTSKA